MHEFLSHPKPTIALAPMDGVTDAAYRYIQKKHGNPDLIITEFTNVVGLCKGAERLFVDFEFHPEERPVIAQVFGSDPEYFYHAAKIVVALGFDGIDINMGCPARKVTERGSGAALIRTPELAKEIINQTRKGFQDYFQDRLLTGVAKEVEDYIRRDLQKRGESINHAQQQQRFSISVKTRTGYDRPVTSEWIKHLSESEPDWIGVHGRTLKQMYTGSADWDELAKAVASTSIPVLTNGDIKVADDAVRMIKHTQSAGVMIGRASYGNPWIFKSREDIKSLEQDILGYAPSLSERFEVMQEHADLHWKLKDERAFIQMRKNLAWYAKDFEGASELRKQLVQVKSPAELKIIIQIFKQENQNLF